jgi:hypothetical protein
MTGDYTYFLDLAFDLCPYEFLLPPAFPIGENLLYELYYNISFKSTLTFFFIKTLFI